MYIYRLGYFAVFDSLHLSVISCSALQEMQEMQEMQEIGATPSGEPFVL